MWNEPTNYCEGCNFGPRCESVTTVWDIASKVAVNYGKGRLQDLSNSKAFHEAKLLMLDTSKAKFKLGWEPRLNIDQTIALTVDWYKRYKNENVYDLCVEEIKSYLQYR
jgi:CDP-glucose 4,6-dehydratase